MANRLIRVVNDAFVQRQREQGAADRCSAEAEHEEIVGRALCRPTGRRFANALPLPSLDFSFSPLALTSLSR